MRGGNWRALEIAGACNADAPRHLTHAHLTVEDVERWSAWLDEHGVDR